MEVTYSISVDPAAVAPLRATLQEAIGQRGFTSADPGHAVDLYAPAMENRVEEVLKDGKIDWLEAPLLFSIVASIASADRHLSVSDVGRIPIGINSLIAIAQQEAPHVDPQQVAALQLAIILADSLERPIFFSLLSVVEESLVTLMALVTVRKEDEWLGHDGFHMAFSWRNGFGLWPLFTDIPPSMAEFEGLRCIGEALSADLAGLRILRAGFESGVLVERHPLVQHFFASPAARYAAVEYFFSADANRTRPPRIWARLPAYQQEIADLARQCGATQFADDLEGGLARVSP